MRVSMFAPLAAAIAMALPLVAVAQDHGRYRDSVIRCESLRGRPQQCAADVRGDVRLVRQLSRNECIEGQTWGVIRDGLWVTNGCRADFLVTNWHRGRRPESTWDFIRCESKEGRSNRCAANTQRGVDLVRQLARDPCIRGQNWGWDKHSIWVTAGCRAEFRTTARRDDEAPPAITRCESIDGAPRHCPADTRGGVRLVRQLSRAECIEGRTWGSDPRGIWVEEGCRAEFQSGGADTHDRRER